MAFLFISCTGRDPILKIIKVIKPTVNIWLDLFINSTFVYCFSDIIFESPIYSWPIICKNVKNASQLFIDNYIDSMSFNL